MWSHLQLELNTLQRHHTAVLPQCVRVSQSPCLYLQEGGHNRVTPLFTLSKVTRFKFPKKHNQDVLRLKHKAHQVYLHLIYVLIHPVITWVFIFQCNASDTCCCDAHIMGQCRGELIYLTRLNSVRLQRWRCGAQWVKLENVNLEFKAFLPNSGEPAGHSGGGGATTELWYSFGRIGAVCLALFVSCWLTWWLVFRVQSTPCGGHS